MTRAVSRFVTLLVAGTALSVTALAQDAGPMGAKPDDLLDFGPPEPLIVVSQSGEHEFMVEVADSLEEQAQGYMWREDIPAGTGMIFELPEPRVATVWMKNTPSPLDILFVRSNGRILKIEHSAQPYKLRSASSEAPVAAFVEFAAGTTKDLGIMPGDLIKHEFFGTAE